MKPQHVTIQMKASEQHHTALLMIGSGSFYILGPFNCWRRRSPWATHVTTSDRATTASCWPRSVFGGTQNGKLHVALSTKVSNTYGFYFTQGKSTSTDNKLFAQNLLSYMRAVPCILRFTENFLSLTLVSVKELLVSIVKPLFFFIKENEDGKKLGTTNYLK